MLYQSYFFFCKPPQGYPHTWSSSYLMSFINHLTYCIYLTCITNSLRESVTFPRCVLHHLHFPPTSHCIHFETMAENKKGELKRFHLIATWLHWILSVLYLAGTPRLGRQPTAADRVWAVPVREGQRWTCLLWGRDPGKAFATAATMWVTHPLPPTLCPNETQG